MKLTHILLLLAAAGLAVLVWRSSQGGPEGVSGSASASSGGGSGADVGTAELGTVPAGSNDIAGGGRSEVTGASERSAADANGSTQGSADEGVTEGPKVELGELTPDPSIVGKYLETDGQGRREALNIIQRRLESGKGLDPKEGGLSVYEVERLVAEMEWLKDNLDP